MMKLHLRHCKSMIKPIRLQPNLLLSLFIHRYIGDGGGDSTVLGMATQSATTSTSSIPSYELMKQRTPNKVTSRNNEYTQSVAPLSRASRYMISLYCWLLFYAAGVSERSSWSSFVADDNNDIQSNVAPID